MSLTSTPGDAVPRRSTADGKTPFEQIVCATMRRSTATADGIVRLLEADLGSQAAMLCRSLSEDVVVLHWLVLHEDDPAWLVDRFFDHEAALAASRHRRGGDHAWPGPEVGRPPSELAEMVDRIRKPSRKGGYGETQPLIGGRSTHTAQHSTTSMSSNGSTVPGGTPTASGTPIPIYWHITGSLNAGRTCICITPRRD